MAFFSEKVMNQIERQIRELQKELTEIQKERDLYRLQPCRGDLDIHKKQEKLEELDNRFASVNLKIRELEKKRRDTMLETFRKTDYESPFS